MLISTPEVEPNGVLSWFPVVAYCLLDTLVYHKLEAANLTFRVMMERRDSGWLLGMQTSP